MREENNELNLSLVAADINGCLTYWNVNDGKVISSAQEGSKSVVGRYLVLLRSKSVHEINFLFSSHGMGSQDEQRRPFIPRCFAFSLQSGYMEHG